MEQNNACHIDVRVQRADFSIQDEYERLRALDTNTGAIVTFAGLVRDLHDGTAVRALTLEHYPGMTERSLQAIAQQAAQRWPLRGLCIIHRIGELPATAQIVFVGTSSAHRQAAFEACEFVMDYLKTRAPFWKKCHAADGDYWVDAKDSDDAAAARWEHGQG